MISDGKRDKIVSALHSVVTDVPETLIMPLSRYLQGNVDTASSGQYVRDVERVSKCAPGRRG